MITDEALRTWLDEAVEGVEPPAGGLEAALDPLGLAPVRGDRHRWVTRRPALAAAAVAAVVLVSVAGTLAAVHHGQPATRSGVSGATASSGLVPPPQQFSSAQSQADGPTQLQGAAAPTSGVAKGLTGIAGPASGTAQSSTSATGAAPVVDGPRVVRTATVTLAVRGADVAGTLSRLRGLVAGDGGYVADSTSSLAGDDPTGTVTLRVPSADYARVRDALAAGRYGTVTALDERGQDVTAQYTDVGARIDALMRTRTSYETLLAHANTVGDVLAVQAQLSDVQQQIESLQGQQKVLADQSDDASIAVTVGEPGGPAPLPKPRSGWSKAGYDAAHGLAGALQALVAASGTALVVVVLIAIVAGLATVGRRRLRRRRL